MYLIIADRRINVRGNEKRALGITILSSAEDY